MALWMFPAEYDPDLRLWWTHNDDLGIATEAESLEQLASKLETIVSEMVEENGAFLSEEQRRGPHEFRIIAHCEMQRRAA